MTVRIPHFRASWSDKMICFLADKTDDFIMAHLVAICESWGAVEKADRCKYVIKTSLKNEALKDEAMATIDSWTEK